MKQESTFKTKTGFCHILPDKIVLSRDGIIGNVANVTVGKSITRILILYGVITIGFLYVAIEGFRNGKMLEPILFVLLGTYLVYGIFTSINNSATPIINRQKIKEIRFKKAFKGLSRSRFEVLFEDEKGKIKKRLIMLPRSITGGDRETKKALKIMKDEGLID